MTRHVSASYLVWLTVQSSLSGHTHTQNTTCSVVCFVLRITAAAQCKHTFYFIEDINNWFATCPPPAPLIPGPPQGTFNHTWVFHTAQISLNHSFPVAWRWRSITADFNIKLKVWRKFPRTQDSQRGQGPEGQDPALSPGLKWRSEHSISLFINCLAVILLASPWLMHLVAVALSGGQCRRLLLHSPDRLSTLIISDPKKTLFCLSPQPHQLSKATLGSLWRRRV